MKTMNKLFLGLGFCAGLVSCSDFDEVNTNPTAAGEEYVKPQYALNNSIGQAQMNPGTAERIVVYNWASAARICGEMSFLNVGRYSDDYTSAYYYPDLSASIKNATLAITAVENQLEAATTTAHEKEFFPNVKQFARIWRAYLISEFVDNFGPYPIESFLGENPVFNSEKDDYEFILKELKEAAAAINTSVLPVEAEGKCDPFDNVKYDPVKWQKYANSLRMRLAMRLSNIDKATAQTEFEDAAKGNKILTADEMFAVKENKKTFIVTANPETFMMSEKDTEMRDLLLDKDTILVPDGIGIVKAARMINYDIKERIAGIDIANKLLELGNKQKKSIYLFGAKQEVIDSMKEVLKNNYPNLKLSGTANGYEKDKDKVFEKIAKAKPDIVLVALGIPLQEKLIYKHLNKFDKGIFVGVGGSFDVISGHKKRAPKLFIKLNLEWLYRILKEPKRIKRFYDSNVKFLFKVKKKDNKKIIDNIFIVFTFLVLFIGLLNTILNSDDINYYENRTAYKMPKVSINKILDKSFQDDVELAFSDQIPLATVMKK